MVPVDSDVRLPVVDIAFPMDPSSFLTFFFIQAIPQSLNPSIP